MAIPPELRWASTSSIWRTAISALTESSGQEPLKPAVVEEINQAFYVLDQWTAYLANFVPDDQKIEVGRITGTGDPDSLYGLFITTDGTGTGIIIGPATGDPLALVVSGAADLTLSSAQDISITSTSATGAMTFGTIVGIDRTGVRIDHANRRYRLDGGAGVNAAAFRYPYQATAPLTLTIPMWPGLGGWTLMTDLLNSVEDARPAVTGNGYLIESAATGVTLDVEARAPVPGITGNAEATGTVYELTAVTSDWAGASTVDPDVEVVARHRTTYVETVLATVNLATPTWAGSSALTPSTHDYYARLTAAIPNSGVKRTTGIKILTLTINKYAVE